MARNIIKLNECNILSIKSFLTMLIVIVICALLLIFSNAETPLLEERQDFYQNKEKQESTILEYTWECQNFKCVKLLVPKTSRLISLESCKITCGNPLIWPQPKSIETHLKELIPINVKNIKFDLQGITGDNILFLEATQIFLNKTQFLLPTQHYSNDDSSLQIVLNCVNNNVTHFHLGLNESYTIAVWKANDSLVTAQISGDNFFGVRHGLETLFQLILFDQIDQQMKVLSGVQINDTPSFSYRGVMVDTARNWSPLYKLKKVIDGMAMAKLNILHLHLTDSASFPIELPSVSEFAKYGAYSKDMLYSVQDIKNLVEYGLVRGVRLLLEIDAPSHVDAGWSYQSDLVICQDMETLGGHLNIDNEKSLKILYEIYRDLLQLMGQNDVFHIGADEVNLNCLKRTEKGKKSRDLMLVWANFTSSMLCQLQKANNEEYPENVIVWSSPLTDSKYLKTLPKNVTVQFWLGSPINILKNGNSIIYSTVDNWYLDCGFGSWQSEKESGVCDPFRSWHKFYKYRPWEKFGYRELALGGEVCLWTEEVDFHSLESRVWPRAAAFAERVWSDPARFDMKVVASRLDTFREKLVKTGIEAAAMWPRWCFQNPEKC